MKERRKYARFTANLPARLEAITPGRRNVLYLETQDISAAGAFFYTKEYFPKETRFILNLTIPSGIVNELTDSKRLIDCNGIMVRSTSKGMAIQFDGECQIESLKGFKVQ